MHMTCSICFCLQDVIALARTPLADLMRDTLGNEVDGRLLNLQAQLQSTSITQAEHDNAVADLEAYREFIILDLEARGACPLLQEFNYVGYPSTGAVGTIIPEDILYAPNIGGGASIVPVSLTPPDGSLLTYNELLPDGGPTCNTTCVCEKLFEVAGAAKQARFDSMQTQLVNRLDRNSGRLGAQKSRKLELMKDIIETELELYDFIIDMSTGLEPLSKPEEAVLDDVIAVYVNGPAAYGVNGQPNVADSMLKRTPIMELNISDTSSDALGTLVERCQVLTKLHNTKTCAWTAVWHSGRGSKLIGCGRHFSAGATVFGLRNRLHVQARRTEISLIQSEVAQLPAVQRISEHMVRTAGDIKAVNYTIAAWVGGQDAFNYCKLDSRAEFYSGTCTDSIPYTLTSVDTAPYACSAFPNGTTLTGSDCIAQVDHQLDCQATCECLSLPEEGQIERGCGESRCFSCGLHCMAEPLLHDAEGMANPMQNCIGSTPHIPVPLHWPL